MIVFGFYGTSRYSDNNVQYSCTYVMSDLKGDSDLAYLKSRAYRTSSWKRTPLKESTNPLIHLYFFLYVVKRPPHCWSFQVSPYSDAVHNLGSTNLNELFGSWLRPLPAPHTINNRDEHPCFSRFRARDPHNRATANLHLRPHGHRDRQNPLVHSVLYSITYRLLTEGLGCSLSAVRPDWHLVERLWSTVRISFLVHANTVEW
jgi:hypothetical protein